ncbi:MBL fold metallo-hydrolase [Kordiimonas pumila]|uniref:MBL fold metallo-hydrolase n=1 Tax=Kordiimonas pumila TaxID=2161677 RepID=A0ABV7D1I5_9PROT|nr:MBL fold metallo-hydrolase [Kordiimonas pumila]
MKKILAPDQENPVPENTEVSDHTTSYSKGDENLSYIFNNVPQDIEIIEVSSGILWARIPLPWTLDHINVYLLDEGDGWTVIDTGAQGKRGRAMWQRLEKKVMGAKPILNVVATHMHPDHLGLAGWLVKRHGAKFYCTLGEYLMAQTLWLGAKPHMPQHDMDFLFRSGVSRKYEEMIRAAGFGRFKKGVHKLPESFQRMEEGMVLTFGGRKWSVVIGRGHSPEHACLVCLDEPLMISGDQILPDITSNVSVYAREPYANPLAHWISSLDRMKGLKGDPVVLPSHGKVFTGLQNRLETLISGHIRKLGGLHAYCDSPVTAVETFPALYRRKISGMEFFMALGEALAHIHLLESLDLMTRTIDGDVYKFQAKGAIDSVDITAAVAKLPGISLPVLDALVAE